MPIRPLLPADLPEIAHVVTFAYSDVLVRLHGQSALAAYQPRTPEMLGTLLELGPEFCLVSEEGGRLTGGIFGRAWGSLGWFSSLAVVPDMQGRGLGRALVEACVGRLRAGGCRAIGLETWAAAADYTAMYVGLGFRPVGLSAQLLARVDRDWPEPPDDLQVAPAESLPDGLRSERLAVADALCDRIMAGLSLAAEIEHAESHPTAHALWLLRDGEICGFGICDTAPDYDTAGLHADLRAAVLDPERTTGDDFLALAAAAARIARAAGREYLDVDALTEYPGAYRLMLESGFRASGQLLRFISDGEPYPPDPERLIFNLGRWST